MLRYLDNAQNAGGHINENYAREIMELHTMGVGSGYTQQDVEELARILTGVGIDLIARTTPQTEARLQGQLVRDGPLRIQSGPPRLRRQDFPRPQDQRPRLRRGRGGARYPRPQPATARHISRELATYFVADNRRAALVDQMAKTFQRRTATSPRCCGRCSTRRSSPPRPARNSRTRALCDLRGAPGL